MRIAFYAPLKSPSHEIPSGDRRVARLLIAALELAGHEVLLASEFRSYDSAGDPIRQAALRDEGDRVADEMVARWTGKSATSRPDLWFTYHVYYKAPDWLGPRVCAALGIPYVIAEASHAPKRRHGPWSIGHDAAEHAIRQASLIYCPTKDDMHCMRPLVSSPLKLRYLPPFLDPAPYCSARERRAEHRAKVAAAFGMDPAVPWIIAAAMMRPGDKLASYRMLARCLHPLTDLQWQLLAVGDGSARKPVEALMETEVRGKAFFAGERGAEELAEMYSACDLTIWPAVNEAYGMAMLEAQAAGLPVVSRAVRGVPDVVADRRSGLLAPAEDPEALTSMARALLLDSDRRETMGRDAARFVQAERSIEIAAQVLSEDLEELAPIGAAGGVGAWRP